tara:strand:- start:11800 stop:11928 length:129 start_codon:yes stop_codon:yes gene_type:complete
MQNEIFGLDAFLSVFTAFYPTRIAPKNGDYRNTQVYFLVILL